MPRLKISPVALRDIQKGVDHYNMQQRGLGARFEGTIHFTFTKIKTMPMAASLAYENVRYKVVDDFPYIVFLEPQY